MNNIEKKIEKKYIRIAAKDEVATDVQKENTKNKKTYKMNPLNAWAGPHFLFYIP